MTAREGRDLAIEAYVEAEDQFADQASEVFGAILEARDAGIFGPSKGREHRSNLTNIRIQLAELQERLIAYDHTLKELRRHAIDDFNDGRRA